MNEVEKALYKLRKLRNIEENEFFSDFKNIDALIKDQEFVYRLMNIERFRNILVHFYWKVEDERLFKILKIENHKFIAFHEHRYVLPQVLGKKRSPLPFS